MKLKFLIFFLIFIFCGNTEESGEVSNTQETDIQYTYSAIAKELIDNEENSTLNSQNPFVVFRSITKGKDLDKPEIIIEAKWENVKTIYIFFGEDCVLRKDVPSSNSESLSTLNFRVNENIMDSCIQKESALAVQIQSSDSKKNLVLLRDNNLYEGTYSSLKQLNTGELKEDEIQEYLFCCHTFNFTPLDNVFNQIKGTFVFSSTTTLLENQENASYRQTARMSDFYFYIDEYRNSSIAPSYIQLRGYWQQIRSVIFNFNDNCELIKDYPKGNTTLSLGTIAINIKKSFEEKKDCNDTSKVTSLTVSQYNTGKVMDTLYLYFYENGEYVKGNHKATKENSNVLCCHDLDFEEINYIFSEALNYQPPTTTSTTTTTTIYSDTEAPTWSNDPISFSKVNPTYLDILWGQANDNEGVSEFKIYANGVLVKIVSAGSTNRTTITGLNPNTSYTFEILACDYNSNCSTDNPSATKKTSESSSSGNSSNVGSIPDNLLQLYELGHRGPSYQYIYPYNGENGRSFYPGFFWNEVEDKCLDIKVSYRSETGYVLNDYIFIGTTPNQNCNFMFRAGQQGIPFNALTDQSYLNSNNDGICEDWYFQSITISYTNNRSLVYFRDGSVGYYENYSTLQGAGSHNLNFSAYDFETIQYSSDSNTSCES